jgi:hypothetical protein
MNGTANQSRTLPTFRTALQRSPAAERVKPEARDSGERPQLGLFQLIAGTFASIVFAVVMLCATAAAAVLLVLALPWLVMLPAIILGLFVTFVGAVLGAAGLI